MSILIPFKRKPGRHAPLVDDVREVIVDGETYYTGTIHLDKPYPRIDRFSMNISVHGDPWWKRLWWGMTGRKHLFSTGVARPADVGKSYYQPSVKQVDLDGEIYQVRRLMLTKPYHNLSKQYDLEARRQERCFNKR